MNSRPQSRTAFLTMTAAPMSRRNALRLAGLSFAAICAQRPAQPALALKPGKPSKEKLLQGIREEKSQEEIEEEKARMAEEKKQRLAKQRELQAAAERKKAGLEDSGENEAEIESNLRGQYYFPTARKRYLPRVKLAWEMLPVTEKAATENQWPVVSDFSAGELTDAVLPMKLYASSLAGGGLSINAKFIEGMNRQTDVYERAVKQLTKAAKRKDTTVALGTITDMRDAIARYRQLGHLEAPDFGIGEIPTDTRVGSGFANNNSALYRKNKTVQEVAAGQT
ncbi:Twin-arginine translocation pathway signal sequence [Gracilaria domingensis]|nr:Twin-arginine translocation pathway signal sequence [Gracilaria domingensis]